MTPRLPDFVVIGAAKSGTTTLRMWLDQQTDVFMCTPKEPKFFSHNWSRGVDWYASRFAGAPNGVRAGESTPGYTRLEHGDISAERMTKVIPDADLVYLLRNPIDRLVSDYRHQVRRGHVNKPILEAIRAPSNEMIGSSSYHARLAPYIAAYPRERICVVRFEDLVDSSATGWHQVLDHLGLPRREAPGDAYNVTDALPRTAAIVGRISMARRRLGLPQPPKWLREADRKVAKAMQHEYRDPLDGRVPELPNDIVKEIWDDVARLEDWLGRGPLWERETLT